MATGGKLTIEPGVRVELNSGVSFYVNGTLTATNVTFTWADEDHPWGQIQFSGSGASESRLENCVIEHAQGVYSSIGYPVLRISNSSPTITGCTISNCPATVGIYLGQASPTISDNTITGFSTHGIYVDNESSPTVTGNTISRNNHGIKINSISSGTYQGNTISGNTTYGLYYNGSTPINAANCNWGSPTGPYDPSDDRASGGWYNPSGLGDKVSGHVNYMPWAGWSVEIKGDVNGDTHVDLADAVAVLHILSGIEIQFAVNPGADVDDDGKITMAEELFILQNISGLR